MVNRDNFLIARMHLDYLRDVYQLNPRTIERYWIYLKHVLLWADATPLCSAADIRPTFPTYLTSARLDGDIGPLAQETLRKIVLTCKRFFVWMKTTYPRQFKDLSTAWIETLRPPRTISPTEDHQFVTLEEVNRLLQAAGLIDAQGQVTPAAQSRWSWQRNFVLPTPHVLLKTCAGDQEVAETSAAHEIKIDIWQSPRQVV